MGTHVVPPHAWVMEACDGSTVQHCRGDAIKPNQVQSSPAQSSPAQPSPAQPSPAQSSPVQSSPVQPSPAQSSPVQSSPVQSSPVQSSPAQSSPAQSSPVQPSPAQPSPVQSSPAESSRVQLHLVQSTACNASDSSAPRRGRPLEKGRWPWPLAPGPWRAQKGAAPVGKSSLPCCLAEVASTRPGASGTVLLMKVDWSEEKAYSSIRLYCRASSDASG